MIAMAKNPKRMKKAKRLAARKRRAQAWQTVVVTMADLLDVFDMDWRVPALPRRDPFARDRAALLGDWKKVGADIRAGIRTFQDQHAE